MLQAPENLPQPMNAIALPLRDWQAPALKTIGPTCAGPFQFNLYMDQRLRVWLPEWV